MKNILIIAVLSILLFSCTLGGQSASRKVSIEITGTGEFWATVLTDTIGQSVTVSETTTLNYSDYKNTTICVDIAVISGTAEVKIFANDVLTEQVNLTTPYSTEKIRVPFIYSHYGW